MPMRSAIKIGKYEYSVHEIHEMLPLHRSHPGGSLALIFCDGKEPDATKVLLVPPIWQSVGFWRVCPSAECGQTQKIVDLGISPDRPMPPDVAAAGLVPNKHYLASIEASITHHPVSLGRPKTTARARAPSPHDDLIAPHLSNKAQTRPPPCAGRCNQLNPGDQRKLGRPRSRISRQ